VEFRQAPAIKPWGIEAVFIDLYGNKYALVQESAQVVTGNAETKALGLQEMALSRGMGGAEPVG
jgi:hypothetical protein